MTRSFVTFCVVAVAISAAAELRLPGKTANQASVIVAKHVPARAAEMVNGVMYESFEYDDQPYYWSDATADLQWLPDGWTTFGSSQATDPNSRWHAYPFARYMYMPCYDGNYVMGIFFDPEYIDEWLVSPEIAIEKNNVLSFGWWYLPYYFWIDDKDHVDSKKGVYTNRELLLEASVMVREQGGEWQKLKNLSDYFLGYEYNELLNYYPEEMMRAELSLADFAGKTIQIAFHYEGTNANSLFIDGVSVNRGQDKLNTLYMQPETALYVGGTVDMQAPLTGFEVLPSGVDLYWTNESENANGTTYTWGYADNMPVVDATANRFVANFEHPVGAPYALYEAPSITAEAYGAISTTYAEPVGLMVGGKPLIADEDDPEIVRSYGLLPFDLRSSGCDIYTEEPVDFGRRGIPIFGYSEDTDAFWRLYTAGGEEENLAIITSAYVTGILNGVLAPEKPLVVNGAWLYAVGKFSDNAQFTCTVYNTDPMGAPRDILAQKTIKGSDAKVCDTRMNLLCYSLPFEFDAPAVLDADGTDGGLYIVMIEGFHDADNVEYFAPMMQQRPNPFGYGFGFYQIEFTRDGITDAGLSSVAWFENEYGEMYCGFAINLDAEYPWLDCTTEYLELNAEGGTARVALDSYYPADRLDVRLVNGRPLPEGIAATGTGRYNKASITIRGEKLAEIDSDVVISGPGVAHALHLTKQAGVEGVTMGGSNPVVGVYDLTGRRVDATETGHGLYIERHADGSAVKSLK